MIKEYCEKMNITLEQFKNYYLDFVHNVEGWLSDGDGCKNLDEYIQLRIRGQNE